MQIELPDGSSLDIEEGMTVQKVAYLIGEGLGDDTLAGKIDGELVAKEEPLSQEDEGKVLNIITEDSDEYISLLRHTAAHVFAQALQRLFPDAKLATGPWTDEGFYYDFSGIDLDKSDLEEIEKEMEMIVEEDYSVERKEIPREEAFDIYRDNPFKRDILETEAAGDDPVSFYQQAEFMDLCKGPHVQSTGEVEAFKLEEVAGAYWRGDEDNEMLTRVYGTAFPSEDDLEEYLERKREAEKRDHRRIGREMDLFQVENVTGPGLGLFPPNGATIFNELKSFIHNINDDLGYDQVVTPHIYRTELWKQSGHYENYLDDMFHFEEDSMELGVKPMNCPGHCMIFDRHTRSYKDLPVRYAEDGTVYRKEQRGELSGILRLWGFTQDDGHVYCRPDQIKEEVQVLFRKAIEILETFDLEYETNLATKNPEKYIGGDEIWDRSEGVLGDVLDEEDIEWGYDEGDAAFYGPKIDMKIIDAIGRQWDGPTIQLDFNMPENLGLSYVDENNEQQTPVMIHRALLGSYERFIGILIEHFAGRFPPWISPQQVRILPVSEDNLEYAASIKEVLDDFRVEIEERSMTLGKMIRKGHDDNVPYLLIVGEQEESNGTISVRDSLEREQKGIDPREFESHLQREVQEKRLKPAFLSE